MGVIHIGNSRLDLRNHGMANRPQELEHQRSSISVFGWSSIVETATASIRDELRPGTTADGDSERHQLGDDL
jgi:hypothetical protein